MVLGNGNSHGQHSAQGVAVLLDFNVDSPCWYAADSCYQALHCQLTFLSRMTLWVIRLKHALALWLHLPFSGLGLTGSTGL